MIERKRRWRLRFLARRQRGRSSLRLAQQSSRKRRARRRRGQSRLREGAGRSGCFEARVELVDDALEAQNVLARVGKQLATEAGKVPANQDRRELLTRA